MWKAQKEQVCRKIRHLVVMLSSERGRNPTPVAFRKKENLAAHVMHLKA